MEINLGIGNLSLWKQHNQGHSFSFISQMINVISIVFGRLDLYLPPPTSDGLKPVVVFVTGGAWIIG